MEPNQLEGFYKMQREPTRQIALRAWLQSPQKHPLWQASPLHLCYIVGPAPLFSRVPFFARKRH